MPVLIPTESQLVQLQSLPVDDPVAALNLFHFHERAHYQPEDPEYGTPEADITGHEAYLRYGATAGPCITELGGRVVFSSAVQQVMIGPDDPSWDLAAIMFFPTRRAFMTMLTNPEFEAASRHRKAAMAHHTMLHIDGSPFADHSG